MAQYLVNLTNGQMDEKGIFWLFGDLLTQSGVVQSAAMSVTAQSTPDMTVKVAGAATGHSIVFITSAGDTYYGRHTDNYNVTISSNATGVTKTDAIVAYADLAGGLATSNNPGALKFVSVRASGAGNPTAADITGSVVGANPYVILAYVTVANGVSSINSGNITDARVRAVLSSGLVPTAAIQDSAVTLSKIASEGWTSYTPGWYGSSGNPVLNTGYLAGFYQKVGRQVFVQVRLKMGADTTYGTGDWTFSLPVTPATVNDFDRPCGTHSAEDAGVRGYMGTVVIASSNAPAAYANRFVLKVHDVVNSGGAYNVGTTRPFTWGNGDFVSFWAIYEAGS